MEAKDLSDIRKRCRGISIAIFPWFQIKLPPLPLLFLWMALVTHFSNLTTIFNSFFSHSSYFHTFTMILMQANVFKAGRNFADHIGYHPDFTDEENWGLRSKQRSNWRRGRTKIWVLWDAAQWSFRDTPPSRLLSQHFCCLHHSSGHHYGCSWLQRRPSNHKSYALPLRLKDFPGYHLKPCQKPHLERH